MVDPIEEYYGVFISQTVPNQIVKIRTKEGREKEERMSRKEKEVAEEGEEEEEKTYQDKQTANKAHTASDLSIFVLFFEDFSRPFHW